jgi:penicillin-binding protein-related factor A (putative recombinase)
MNWPLYCTCFALKKIRLNDIEDQDIQYLACMTDEKGIAVLMKHMTFSVELLLMVIIT